MTLFKKAAALAGVTAMALAGTVAAASPAAAATYDNECGSGYGVVNRDAIGNRGTVFLTFNPDTGKNCVLAKRDSPGARVIIEAGLSIHPAGNHWDKYDGDPYTSYAGPIYLSAAGQCVDWMGRIDGVEGGKRGTNCG